jgi:hypothetical protein
MGVSAQGERFAPFPRKPKRRITMEHFTKGDKVIYSAADGEYFATVIRVNRGVVTVKYFVKGTSAVSYLPQTQWHLLRGENTADKQSFAQMRWDSYYENYHE